MRLKNKVAIITGGTSGIGLATANLFLKEGSNVIVMGRDSQKAKKLKKGIIFMQGDVSNEQDIKRIIDTVYKKFKKIDILCNNAGIEPQGDVIETTSEEWDKVLNINLKGVFYGCKYAIPYMKKNKNGGSIVNTASAAGIVGFNRLAAYCASKGGVVLLTKQMALDFAKDKIRINAVCPGGVDTPMAKNHMSQLSKKQAKEIISQMHPLGRMGKPEEIANSILFLASDESSFVTGEIFSIDGGLTAR